jgi:Na+/H+ antiporter NhaD/arsenite permease-like protein
MLLAAWITVVIVVLVFLLLALDLLGHRVLGQVRTEGVALVRLALVVVPLSAFLNNTPLVAMFIPVVLDWCRRNQIAPSRLLLPLSYLAILGGTCTLIGTSTNVVVGTSTNVVVNRLAAQ